MTLVLRIAETEEGPRVFITNEENIRGASMAKAVKKNGESLRGLLCAAAEYDQLLPELVLFAQHAFDLGREYEKNSHEIIDARAVAKRFFGYKGLPDQHK